MRIKFRKGKQREFIVRVMERIRCPSLRALNQFGFSINYQTLKSYYHETRTLTEEFFNQLCEISGIKPRMRKIRENWGQVKGGKN